MRWMNWVTAAAFVATAALAQDLPVIDSPEKAQAAQKAASEKLGKPVEWTNSVGMKFRLIPAGEFTMGAPGLADAPPHRVRITQPFYMGMTELTRSQYETVTESVRSTYFPGADVPINCVDCREGSSFLSKLNKKETAKYRLPTEAEWEYAARAGAATEPDLDKVAWSNANSGNALHPVAQKAPNAFGLFDTLGNAWEWCSDFYDADYYKDSPVDDPKGPEKSLCRYRALRGGSIYYGPASCGLAARAYYQESRSEKHIGLRIVLPILPEAAAPAK